MSGEMIDRIGDDLFFDGKKLSVSIATATPVSTLIHVGVNVTSSGAPIPISSLDELTVDEAPFAEQALAAFEKEIHGMDSAVCKVRPLIH